MNWLERARREIEENARKHTDVTDERIPTSLMAVPNTGVGENLGASNVDDGNLTSLTAVPDPARGGKSEGSESYESASPKEPRNFGKDKTTDQDREHEISDPSTRPIAITAEGTPTAVTAVDHLASTKSHGVSTNDPDFGKGQPPLIRQIDTHPDENEKCGVLPLPKESSPAASHPRETEKTAGGPLPLLPKEVPLEHRALTVAGPLELARSLGIKISVDRDRLIFVGADAPPPADIVALLKRNEASLLALVRKYGHGWTQADWRAFYDERAAVAEHKGGLPRLRAEAEAFKCCIVEWLNRNPIISAPVCCCWCGGRESQDNVLLPFGVESTGHCWLHRGCWEAWRAARRAKAMEALAQYEIAENRPLDRWFIPSI